MKRRALLFLCVFCWALGGAYTCFAAEVSQITLTAEERRFIEEHPVIRAGVGPGFRPFEYFEDGEYTGISSDYVKLIEKATGLKIEPVTGLTWPEAYDAAINREIDILPAIVKNDEGLKYFNYSEMYYSYKRAIVVREDNKTIGGFGDLGGTPIAVRGGGSYHRYLMERYNLNFSLYSSESAAVAAVANGEEVAAAGNLATIDDWARGEGVTNLKYIIIPDENETTGLHMATRNDWPELGSIVDKAMAKISPETRKDIRSRWVALDAEVNDNSAAIRVSVGIAVILLVFLIGTLALVRHLRGENERRRKIQEQLTAVNEAQANFMTRMSHEIRTPLNAVIGMSYLLRRRGLSKRQENYVNNITQASRVMLSIIDDILRFSNMEHMQSVSANPVDLGALVDGVCGKVKYQVEERKLQFSCHVDPHTPQYIIGDRKCLEQILLNLLDNAVKFTLHGSVSVIVRPEEDRLIFAVSDTGVGISEQQMGRLFTPFSQEDGGITRAFGGTGIGLYLVKTLTDMMGGTIGVHSVKHEGSAFTVSLPLIPCDERAFREYSDSKHVERENDSYCALLVEDNMINCEIARELLEDVGWRVFEAHDGEQGVAAYIEHKSEVNIVLMDLHMPVMDGYEASRRIRAISSVPIAAVTADVVAGTRERCVECGIEYYISKPFDPDVLTATIKKMVLNSHTV
ncbi:hypothetical protein FACS1894208_07350 [Clostridia bacterium]|nr:hypothetical protein FACS1894208_07350 [Clostridia bacterium]